MDVREKLVELIFDSLCRHIDKSCKLAENIADDLISDGVTVQENVEISDELLKQLKNAPITICKEEPSIELMQEWISVDDRLPDQSGEVLVIVSGNPQKNITLNFAYELAEYDPYDGWIMEMWPEWEDAVVTYWMPIPQPPKGE